MTGGAFAFAELLELKNDRRARDGLGLALVEGVRFVMRAAERPTALVGLVLANKLLDSAAARRLLRETTVPVMRVGAEEFRRLSIAPTPQGIAAVVRQEVRTLADGAVKSRVWACLESVRSPGNLGTIARTCEAAGAGLMLLGDELDPYDPQVMRASMGSLLAIRKVRATAAELRAWKRERSATIVGASADARRDFRTLTGARPLVLMIGCERRGMSATQRGLCDTLVRIPMVGGLDSLNVAVAAGLLLYETYRARWPLGG